MEFLLTFIFGAVVGSFVNVCVYRLPRELSLSQPPSRCSFCGQPILWYDNIPLASYLALGGKCRYCQSFFSFRYFLVEGLVAFLFTLCYCKLVASQPKYPLGLLEFDRVVVFWARNPELVTAYFIGCTFIAAIVVATFVDFDYQIIPDSVTLGGMAVAIVISFVFPHFHRANDLLVDGLIFEKYEGELLMSLTTWFENVRGLAASLLGALVGAGIVWFVGFVGKLIFRKDAMGMGDVKFNAMIGAFLGWQVALGTLVIGSIFGALAGILILLWTKQSRMPFGPYLALGALILFLFWEESVLVLQLWTSFVQRVAVGM